MSEISFSMKMDWLQCIGQSDEAIRTNQAQYAAVRIAIAAVFEVRFRGKAARIGQMRKKHHHADHRIHDIAPQTASRSDRRRTGIWIGQGTFLPPIPQGDRQNVQRISDRPAIGRRLQKTVRFLCADSQHRKGMQFPDTRALQTAVQRKYGIRAGIPRTIRKSKLTSNKTSNMKRRKYDWACTNHPSYKN